MAKRIFYGFWQRFSFVQNQASLDSIKEADMKYFIFLATLDKRTSNKYREHDRKVYPIDEAQAGSNMPPLHPHCRSTIAGNLTDYDTGKGKRTAKDNKGNRIIIPAGMNYDDYYKIYVEKSKSLVQWKKEQWKKNHSGTESVQTKPIQNQKSKNDIKNDIESFTPLKTKQEALNYAQKLVSDSITIDDSLHINAINATLEAMYNIYKRFGQKLSIKRIEYYNDSYRSYAAYVQETQTLCIKGKNANFVAMQEKINKKNFASKWNASEDRYGILYHELGHMFETMLPKKSWNEIKNIYNNVKHDNYLNWMELGGSSSGKSQQDLFGNVLSRYALTDNKEFFAEAFSQIMSGKMRPVSRQVKRVLDNAFKDDIIKEEISFKMKELKIKHQYVNYPPKQINIKNLDFDDNHINNERHHNVSEKEAKQFIEKTIFSITKYNGHCEIYCSSYSWVYILDDKIKWYIDCSVGGAQFGQGMYCSSDYTKGSRIKEVDSIMDYYINEYSRHDKKFYKVETLALDKTAKILYVPRERVFSGMPLIKTIAKTYVKNNPEEFGLLYIDLTNVNRLNEEEFNLYKSAYIKKADEILLKKLNIAVIATQLGYDAIKVERRSSDLPHTIILNRTKIIIFEGDFNE